MKTERIIDILDHARLFHKIISDYYHSLSEDTYKPKLKILLEYLARHEKNLSDGMGKYEEIAPDQVLNSWVNFSIFEDKLKPLLEKLKVNNNSADEIVGVALKIDDCIIKLYEELAKKAEVVEIQDLFQSLLELEKHERFALAKATLRVEE